MIDRCLNQSQGQLRYPAAAVESEYELIDVRLQIGTRDAVVSAQQHFERICF